MADSGKKLTKPLRQRYRLVALCLAIGMSEEETAAHCHVSVENVKSYMRDDRFDVFLEDFNHQIEQGVIERITRRRIKTIAKLQMVSEEAADRVIDLMRLADRDTVSLAAATKILKQSNIDLDKTIGDNERTDPEADLRAKNPSFFQLEAETMKELGDGSDS